VPADENRFGSGHGYNTSPTDGTPSAIVSATGKIKAKAQLLAGVAMDAAPESLRWDNGAFVRDGNGDGGDADADRPSSQTIADIALYAHGSGALPPGIEGGLDAQTVYRD
jgi:carbon-monoxide dehydrogenase large subunit